MVASWRPPSRCLDHGHLDAGFRELGEGRGSEHLELGRLEKVGFGAHALDRRVEIRFLPAHANPLAPPAHVWG